MSVSTRITLPAEILPTSSSADAGVAARNRGPEPRPRDPFEQSMLRADELTRNNSKGRAASEENGTTPDNLEARSAPEGGPAAGGDSSDESRQGTATTTTEVEGDVSEQATENSPAEELASGKGLAQPEGETSEFKNVGLAQLLPADPEGAALVASPPGGAETKLEEGVAGVEETQPGTRPSDTHIDGGEIDKITVEETDQNNTPQLTLTPTEVEGKQGSKSPPVSSLEGEVVAVEAEVSSAIQGGLDTDVPDATLTSVNIGSSIKGLGLGKEEKAPGGGQKIASASSGEELGLHLAGGATRVKSEEGLNSTGPVKVGGNENIAPIGEMVVPASKDAVAAPAVATSLKETGEQLLNSVSPSNSKENTLPAEEKSFSTLAAASPNGVSSSPVSKGTSVALESASLDKLMDKEISDFSTPPKAGAPAGASRTEAASPSLPPASLVASGGRVAVPVEVRFGHDRWSGLVADRTASLVMQNVQSAQLQLDPPELGPLTVKIQVHQDQATVHFVATNPAVKEALDSTMAKLREMLQEQGLELSDSSVSDQSQQQEKDQQSPRLPFGQGQGAASGSGPTQASTVTLSSGIDYFV